MNTMPEDAMDAVIYLKDGKRKYGMLIDMGSEENYHFISSSSGQMEIVPAVTIDAIDTYLK
ncbi:MAG: hypothetical protein ACJ77K_08565 [Bacteroidia bacterium]